MKQEKFETMIIDFSMREVEKNMEDQEKTMSLLRDTAKILIGASGFILGITGLVGAAFPAVKFSLVMLIPFGLYLGSFILSLFVVLGSKWTIPFTMKSYEALLETFQGVDLKNETYQDFVNQRLNNYLYAQAKNVAVVVSRTKLIRWAVCLFVLAVISVPIILLFI